MTKTLATLALFGALAFAFYGIASGRTVSEGPKWPKNFATMPGL